MIRFFLNWIKAAITPRRQKDEHLEFYENKRSHCEKCPKYKHRCPDCREAVK
jgi:hypothetical protein